MSNIHNLIAIICILLASACTGSTKHGDCIGVIGDKDPELHYDVSVRNAFWSIVAIETVVVPILWVTDYAYCPVGKKVSQ